MSLPNLSELFFRQLDPATPYVVRNQARVELEALQQHPAFLPSLTALFASGPAQDSPQSLALRLQAGLLLKNLVRASHYPDAELVPVVVSQVPQVLASPAVQLRRVASQILSQACAKTNLLQAVPHFADQLMSAVLQASDANLADGASLCMVWIAEDASGMLDADEAGRPLFKLVPFWIHLFAHPSTAFRERALKCLLNFSAAMPPAMNAHAEEYFRGLAGLVRDPSTAVQRRVLRGLTGLLEHRFDLVEPQMAPLVELCLGFIDAPEEGVAMAAIEFFNVLLCEVSDPAPALAAPQVIERLVPALMRRLPYSAEDVAAMWDEMQADAQVADREEDIRPHFGMLGKAQGRFGEEDSEEEGEAEAAGGLWTARRRAGKCLENLSGKLAAQVVLPSVVACLERGLSSAAWPQREGALMGLGAVALGCAHGLEPHLPALLPFVVSQTEDAAAPLRRIALWTLGRFARWLCARPHDFFPAALEAVLRRVGDVNKGVQHAAVSALDFLLENSGEARAVDASAARKILDALCGSLQHAQANQLSYTWDSLALAFSTCELRSSAGGDWAARYLPALWNKFAAAASTDPWLASASFAMSKSVAGFGPAEFEPYKAKTMQRCLEFCEEALGLSQGAASIGEAFGEGDFDYLSWVLVLVYALVPCFSPAELAQSHASILRVICQCATELGDASVLESGLDVVGEVLSLVPTPDAPQYADLLLVYARQSEEADVCASAVWALCMLMRTSGGLVRADQTAAMLDAAAHILVSQEKGEVWALNIDAAVFAGQLAQTDAAQAVQVFSARGGEALRAWTKALVKLGDDEDKTRAFAGWLAVAGSSPGLAAEMAAPVCRAVFGYRVDRTLDAAFGELLGRMKLANPAEWARRFGSLPPDLQKAVGARFG